MKAALLPVLLLVVGVFNANANARTRELPPYKLPASEYLRNACLIDAVEMAATINAAQRLHRVGVRTDILVYWWTGKRTFDCHAACIFEWQHRVWVWDVRKGPTLIEKTRQPFEHPLQTALEYDAGAVRACYYKDWPNMVQTLSNAQINQRLKGKHQP